MAKNLTEQEGQKIMELYKEGKSYTDIVKETGFTCSTICKRVKGMRSAKDAQNLCIKQGKRFLTDEGRQKLSENGIKSCQKSGKYYTKPEREFQKLLNEIGIGVKFPEYIRDIKKIIDDENKYCLLYQYPIQRYVLDFVDCEKKIAININGDYWHGNPMLYDVDKLGKMQIINIRQDKNKKIFLEKNGWKVVDIWESEIYWNKELVIEKLRVVGIMVALTAYIRTTGVRFSHSPPELDWSETLKRLWFKKDRKPRTKVEQVTSICKCGKEFVHKANDIRKYCSKECVTFYSRKNRPSKEELEKLVNEISMVKIGQLFNVSDVAIRNWCKEYGIVLGNRLGYWSKKR